MNMLVFSHLNYWAVLVTVVINIAVGSFWYSPAGFGKLWSKLTGIDMMKMKKKDANTAIAITMVSAIVQTYLLAVVVRSLYVTTMLHGLVVGLVLWAGFVAATTVSDTLYARRGWKLWKINSGYYLLVLLVNASILAVWR